MENNKNEMGMEIPKSLLMNLVMSVVNKMKFEFPGFREDIKIVNNIAENDRFEVNIGNGITLSFIKNDFAGKSWKCVSNHGFCYFHIFYYGVNDFSSPSLKTCPEMRGADIIRLKWFFTNLIKHINEWIVDTRFPHDKWAVGINGSPNIGVDETGHFVINSDTVTQIIDETALNLKTLNVAHVYGLGTGCKNAIQSIDDVNKLIRDWLRLKYGKDIKIVSLILGSDSIRIQVGPFKSQRVIIVDTDGHSYSIYNTMEDINHLSIRIVTRICTQQLHAFKLSFGRKCEDFSDDEMRELTEYINNTISSNNKEEDNNMKNKKTFNEVEKSCKAKIRQFIGDRVIPLVNNFIETNCVWDHRRHTTPNHNENWWKILGEHGHLIEFGFEFLEYPDKLRFYVRNIWGEEINYFMWEYPYRIIKTHPLENCSLMSDLFEYFNQVMIKTDIKSEYIKFLSSTDLEQEIIKLTIKSVLGSNPPMDNDECSDTVDHIIPKKEHDEPSEEEIQEVLDASYPLCVIKDKYGGTYSDGKYTAWICGILYIPDGVFKDDITCSNTWRELKESRKNGKAVYGIGKTPDEALNDLAKTIIRNFKEE